MDPTLTTVVMGGFTAAISALFWQLMKAKDDRIAQLERDNDALEAKIETLNDQLGKNSDALDQVAATQEQVAGLLASLLTSPPSSGGPNRSGTA